MTWTKVFNAQGPAGAQLRTGSGAPSSSLGNVGDTYVDTTSSGAPIFYAAKTSSGWPTTGTSLVGSAGNPGSPGAAGSQFYSGTSVPGPTFQKSIGDLYLRTTTGDLYQLISSGGGSGWTLIANLIGPQGLQGLSLLSGSGAPSASLGAQGQVYIDTTAGNLYTKGSSAWVLNLNLIGPQGSAGASIRTGTGAPSSSVGNLNDIYVDLTAGAVTLYGNKTSSGWPSSGTLLTGSQGNTGSAGLSVLSGSGAPSSSLGVNGQPAYIDTTAGALYGAKASGAWPSSALSLVGQQGPPSPSITNGSGAPSSTNPGGTIQPGSFYIRTDTTPNFLYGPYTTANGWPTSYTAIGGGQFQTTNGPPASTLGSVGDCAIDLTNALFYPPKTQSGWVTSPINLVGSTGAPGPARGVTKGYVWLASSAYATANAATPVVQPLTQSGSYSTIPLVEPMWSSGQIVAVTAYCTGATTNCNATINVLKNGTALCSFTNVVACLSASTATTGYQKASNVYTFAAGDTLSMTVQFSASGGQELYVALHYVQNS